MRRLTTVVRERFAGFCGVACAVLYGGSDFLIDNLQNFGAVSKKVVGMDLEAAAKGVVGWIFAYQWAGSARHLYWDMTAKGFTNQQMLHSSYALVASTGVLGLALAMYSLPPAVESKQKK